MDPDYDNPGNSDQWAQEFQDNQNPRMDSFEGILAKIHEMAEKEDRLDSNGRNARILAELSSGLANRTVPPNSDEVMDSLESVPSGVIRNFGGMERTSLPQMDSTELERTFHLEAINNAELAISPPQDTTGNSEATFHTLETYPLVTQPLLDPNQEIHGGPGVPFIQTDPCPMNESESMQFQQATSTSHVREETMMAKDDEVMSTESEELYRLPPENKLEITVHYSKYPVGGTVTVEQKGGCVLFYEKTAPELIDKVHCVSFPSVQNTEFGKKFAKANPKALELTKRALNALQGGLQLYWENNELFALRKTRGKVYWTSTQSDNNDPQELPRNVPAVVFQRDRFRLELSHAYAKKATNGKQNVKTPMLPAVFFSFAQKWCPKSSPISSCLVWVKVVPKKAEDMVLGLFPEASSAPFVTLNSFHLQLSSS